MDPLPHWLEKTVFAAGMTAYAVEVDKSEATVRVAPAGDAAAEGDTPDSYH